MAVITLTTGTAFIMWLGEQITERGIGNGISLIIFAGIVVRLPSALGHALRSRSARDQFTLLGALLLIAFVVGLRRLRRVLRARPAPHPDPARAARGRTQGDAGRHELLPAAPQHGGRDSADLRVVDPDVPAHDRAVHRIRRWSQNFFDDYLHYGSFLYNALYVALIVFFAFFYTAIVINPTDVADNIKRSGAYIPGIRPGKRTAEYIDRILGATHADRRDLRLGASACCRCCSRSRPACRSTSAAPRC